MTSRFPALMAVLRFALKNNDLACQAPSNKFSRNVLKMLRNQSYIAGFSFSTLPSKTPHHSIYHGFPKVLIFLTTSHVHDSSLIILPRLYPRTTTNFRPIKYRRLKRISSMKENLLISTSGGLIFSNEYIMSKSNRRTGGILILKIIVK